MTPEGKLPGTGTEFNQFEGKIKTALYLILIIIGCCQKQ